jgi:hypothetical protein
MEMVGTVPAANHVSLYCKIGKWGRGFHSRSCDSYGPWFRKDSIWIGSGLPIWQSLRPYKDTVGQAECREVWLFSYISPFLTASFILWFWVPFAILLRSWLIFQPSSENMKGQHVDDAVIRSSNWVGRRRRSWGHVAFWTASLVKEYSVLSMGFTTPIYRLSTLPMTGTLFPSSPLTFSFWDSLFSLSTNSVREPVFHATCGFRAWSFCLGHVCYVSSVLGPSPRSKAKIEHRSEHIRRSSKKLS